MPGSQWFSLGLLIGLNIPITAFAVVALPLFNWKSEENNYNPSDSRETLATSYPK